MSLAYILLVAIVFLPIQPIYAVEGVSSVIRLDILLSVVLVVTMLASFEFRRRLAFHNRLFIAILLISIYLYTSSISYVAVVQLLLYFSMYCSYYLGYQAVQDKNIIFIRVIFFLLAINCLIHLSYYFFQIDSAVVTHINGLGQVENDFVFGLFGVSKMPFQFILYVAAFLFISLAIFSNLGATTPLTLILILVSAATSESRIGFFALFVGFILTLKPAKAVVFLFPAILISPFVLTEKMSFISSMDLTTIMNDPSLVMRLVNLENFITWLSPERVFLGGGAFAHLQFTSTYGQAGALDILFVRLLAEFGFVIFLVGVMYFLLNLWRILNNSNAIRRRLILGWIFFILAYSIMNEGVIASRSGHLVFFVLGLLFATVTKPAACIRKQ